MKKVKNKANNEVRRFRRVTADRVVKVEDMQPIKTKVRVTMYLDLDVLNYFKQRAEQPNAAPYQTQINNELREAMKRDSGNPYDVLLKDDRFISALAARLKETGAVK